MNSHHRKGSRTWKFKHLQAWKQCELSTNRKRQVCCRNYLRGDALWWDHSLNGISSMIESHYDSGVRFLREIHTTISIFPLQKSISPSSRKRTRSLSKYGPLLLIKSIDIIPSMWGIKWAEPYHSQLSGQGASKPRHQQGQGWSPMRIRRDIRWNSWQP
jgi:hypothetical protein